MMVMLLFKQLEFTLSPLRAVPSHGRDPQLETEARELLRQHGADRLAARVHVSWNRRLQSAAGQANYRAASVTLNPRLHDHDIAEIDRTLRHELAHLLAQFRAGRRRIAPHGEEWREACRDLGIADEKRCHALAFPIRRHRRRFVYRCPSASGRSCVPAFSGDRRPVSPVAGRLIAAPTIADFASGSSTKKPAMTFYAIRLNFLLSAPVSSQPDTYPAADIHSATC